MKKFIFLYTGNDGANDDWAAWFTQHGASFVDSGNPFGAGRLVTADGNSDVAAVTGYSLVLAEDLAAAEAFATTSPAAGVQAYEALAM